MRYLFAMLLPATAHAAPAGGAAGAGSRGFDPTMLIMLAAVFAIFYFLMIRPESKRRKERQEMLDALKRGDRVVTLGGLYGEIQDVHDDRIVLRIAEGVKVEVSKQAISAVRE